MTSVVFIRPTYHFYTVGKLYPIRWDRVFADRVGICADDGDRVSSDSYDLLIEEADEMGS